MYDAWRPTLFVDGSTLAYGHFVHENGRLCVRVTKLRTS